MFPGVVSAPFAMVKLGPDCGPDHYSGYSESRPIEAFSMMHVSGTGGAPTYGVVAQFPVPGTVNNPVGDLSSSRSSPDEAEVGYYQSSLSSGVTVQLAATEHAAMFHYDFESSSEANVVVDVSHILTTEERLPLSQHYLEGNITVLPDGSYQGSGTYDNGYNLAPAWTIYFCGRFDNSTTAIQTFSGSGSNLTRYDSDTTALGTERVGAVYSFSDSSVTSRVGISFISSARACQHVDDEMSDDVTLQNLVDRAQSRWNTEVFSKVQTPETNSTLLQLLYSSLYGMHLLPSNRTGENPLWQSSEPYYDDIFTLWDLFRCSTALIHVIQPKAYEEQLRSMIDIWRNEGYLPGARHSNNNGLSQGGSSADNVLADAYVKGVRGAIDWEDGYAAMVKNAEVQPPNNNDFRAPDASTKEGRGALPDWVEYVYITPNFTRAVSRAVEYSVNDFSLYQVAKGLGHDSDAEKYLSRSAYWRNHWNPNSTSLGFSGFVMPRNANGTFVYQDPLTCKGCYWQDEYYQGLPWEHSFTALHDVERLVDLTGGDETFVNRLNTMFQPGFFPEDENRTIFNGGNQPSFATPYLYNFAGRQDLSVQQSRRHAKTSFRPAPNGLPGNSDAGAMQTWLLWYVSV